MSSRICVVPWIEGTCSLYAIVRDGVCLADEFLGSLLSYNRSHAVGLLDFLDMISHASHIRPLLLRPERPELGVYAMYNYKELDAFTYNPSRLLCSYVGDGSKILLVGAGFIKARSESIQSNGLANGEAVLLADVAKMVNNRISNGEIVVSGSVMIPQYPDSLQF